MAYLDGIDLDPGLFRDKAAAEPPKPRGMLRSVGDTALSFGQGAVQGVRMLTDLAGADNAASGGLRTAEQFLAELKSPQAQADLQEQARILKEAEDAGVLEQVLAAGKAFLKAPVQTIAQGAGTIVPTVAATLLTGGAGAVARLAAPAIVGAAQGTGNVKGQIYDTVKRQYLEDGATEAEADAKAAEAQAYSGRNADQLALGGALGAVAGSTGAERALGMLKFGGKAPGVTARVARGAVTEAIPEAAQGAQEQVAQNVALQREGFDVPTARGVASSAALEGLAGAALGGLTGIPKPREPVGAPALPVLAAANVDEAIAAAQQAVAPKAEAKPDNALAALRDTALAELGPLDRQEALRLLAAAENPQAGPGVRAFAKQRLTQLLEPGAGLPGAEVTELDPADLIPTGEANELTTEQFDQMMLRRPTPSQRAAAAKGPLPVGEATEIDPAEVEPQDVAAPEPIPVGEVQEFTQRIPVGQATELQPGDLLTTDNMPYGSRIAALARARKEGLPPDSVVEIPNAGYVVRPKENARVNQPDVAAPAGLAAGARDVGAPDAGGSSGDVGRVPAGPGGVQPAAQAPVAGGAEVAPAGAGGQPDAALSAPQSSVAPDAKPASWVIREKGTGKVVMETFDKAKVDALNTAKYEAVPILQHLQEVNRQAKGADYPSLDSDDLPTLKRKWAEAVRAGRTGEAKAINDRIVALKAKQQPAPAQGPEQIGNRFVYQVANASGKWAVREQAPGAKQVGPLLGMFGDRESAVAAAKAKPAAAPAAPAPAPSREVMPEGLFVQYQGKTFKVDSLEDAQRKWAQFRDVAAGGGPAGVSEVGNGVRVVDGAGRLVARVAYNGRLFDPNDQVMAEAPDRKPMPEGVRKSTAEGYIPPRETLEEVEARMARQIPQELDARAAEAAGTASAKEAQAPAALPTAPAPAAPQAAPRKTLQEARTDAALERTVSENGERMTRRQWVERKVAEGLKTRITQEDRIKPMSRMQYFRATNEEQRAHERRIKEAGKKDVYWIGDYEVTKTEHDYALRLATEQAATPPAKEGPTTQGATDGQELQGQGEGGRRQALTPAGEAAVPSGSSAEAAPAPEAQPAQEATGRPSEAVIALKKRIVILTKLRSCLG